MKKTCPLCKGEPGAECFLCARLEAVRVTTSERAEAARVEVGCAPVAARRPPVVEWVEPGTCGNEEWAAMGGSCIFSGGKCGKCGARNPTDAIAEADPKEPIDRTAAAIGGGGVGDER